jgi:hypothetical protein
MEHTETLTESARRLWKISRMSRRATPRFPSRCSPPRRLGWGQACRVSPRFPHFPRPQAKPRLRK